MKKLKTTFVLKKYSAEEKLVVLYGNFGYKEFDVLKTKFTYKSLRYYTGIRVKNDEWDNENKIPWERDKLFELRAIEKSLHDIYNYMVGTSKEITPDLLRDEMDKKLSKNPKKKNEIHESKKIVVITQYMKEVLLVEKKGRDANTIKNFNKLRNKILAFEKREKIVLTSTNMNEDLYLKFSDYLRKRLGRINSVWSELKNFKAVINEIRRKYKLKEMFDPIDDIAKKDKVKLVSGEKVYLDFEAIKRIIEHEPKTDCLKNTKLILLCLVFSGCRYSDVFKIKPEYECTKRGLNFNYTRFADQKQDSDIIVPILKPLADAFEANGGKPPYEITDVKFNKYVKELAEDCDLKEDRTLSFTDSYGKTKYESKPFYQFVSSHIGRRSFITNLINFVPVTILAKITGHSLTNKSVIFSYNKVSLLDNTVMFLKELERVQESNPKEFPIRLV